MCSIRAKNSYLLIIVLDGGTRTLIPQLELNSSASIKTQRTSSDTYCAHVERHFMVAVTLISFTERFDSIAYALKAMINLMTMFEVRARTQCDLKLLN